MKMRVDLRSFFAYVTLASWLGLTPVAAGTAIRWSATEGEFQVAFQHHEDFSDELLNAGPQVTKDELAQLRRGAKIDESTDDKVLNAARAAQIERRKFWWEFGAWMCLAILGSALLAEPKEKAYDPS